MNATYCCCPVPDDVEEDIDDFLLLGLQGSGKTLLAQRLRTIHAKDSGALRLTTTETNGSQDFKIPTQKSCPFKEIRIRECGGSMLPLWRNWYSRPLRGVIFTLDLADASSLAAASVELCRVLQDPELRSKKVCLVLTKTDLPMPLSRPELDLALGLGELQRTHHGRLHVATVSAALPLEQCPGLRALLDLLMDLKTQDLGLGINNKK